MDQRLWGIPETWKTKCWIDKINHWAKPEGKCCPMWEWLWLFWRTEGHRNEGVRDVGWLRHCVQGSYTGWPLCPLSPQLCWFDDLFEWSFRLRLESYWWLMGRSYRERTQSQQREKVCGQSLEEIRWKLIRILSQRSHTGNTAHAGVVITGAQGCVQGDLWGNKWLKFCLGDRHGGILCLAGTKILDSPKKMFSTK